MWGPEGSGRAHLERQPPELDIRLKPMGAMAGIEITGSGLGARVKIPALPLPSSMLVKG